MVVYYVNMGRFATFAEANRYRRDRVPGGKGYVLASMGSYTVRLLATPKRAEAERWLESGRKDIWISGRDAAGGEDEWKVT
jgi:hypothetical protein